jgi:hypothetical protein
VTSNSREATFRRDGREGPLGRRGLSPGIQAGVTLGSEEFASIARYSQFIAAKCGAGGKTEEMQ